MRITKKLTVQQFVNQVLLTWNYGAKPASISYITNPKLTKDGEIKFGQVTKIANVGVMLGYSYESSVNNQLERESKERDFVAQPLWKGKGKRINTVLAMHVDKGTLYLSYKAQQTFKSFHFDSVLNLIPNSLIKSYFPTNDPTKYQGTEIAVYHREISLENVRKVKVNGITYELIH